MRYGLSYTDVDGILVILEFDTLGETFGKAGDLILKGYSVHIYPLTP